MAREKGMGNLQREKSGRWTMRVGIGGKRYCRSTRTRTGIRPNGCCNGSSLRLDWASINIAEGVIQLVPQKTKRHAHGKPVTIHHSSLNQRFWLKDVDFSCASPWNDSCGSQRAGTLISKRHIIFANHFPLWKGVRILFVDREGEVCPCHVAATKPLKRGDIMLGLLDYEVTPNIRPAKILPDDYAKYIGDGKGLPIVTFNQREQVFLSRLDGISTNANLRLVSNVTATNQPWKALGGKIVGGDSGNPAFLLIGNEPILLYCLFSGGAGLGPSVFHFRKEIQAAMDELCPGYKLEVFDFEQVKSEK